LKARPRAVALRYGGLAIYVAQSPLAPFIDMRIRVAYKYRHPLLQALSPFSSVLKMIVHLADGRVKGFASHGLGGLS
jgi:hypothetical protein